MTNVLPTSTRRRDAIIAVTCAIVAAATSLWFFSPRFWLWPGLRIMLPQLSNQPELMRAYCTLVQVHQPWAPVPYDTHRVLEWRLFFPVVAHYLAFPQRLVLLLPGIGCCLVLTMSAWLAWTRTRNAIVAGSTALLCATFSWFFVSSGWLCYFDSWLVLALLTVAFADAKRLLLVVGLVAPWIDERFILALPICMAIRLGQSNEAGWSALRKLGRDTRGVWVGPVIYLAIRGLAEALHLRDTAAAYQQAGLLFTASFEKVLTGLWHGLRLGWVVILIAVAAKIRTKGAQRFSLSAICVGLALIVSLTVNLAVAADLSRSVSIAAPMVVAGVIWGWSLWPTVIKIGVPLLAVGNLLLPAHHVVATFDAGFPISSFREELEKFRHKPNIVNPVYYNSLGLRAVQENDYVKALPAFEAATVLDPSFAIAHGNFGIVLILAGQDARGAREIDQALLQDSTQHFARLRRAQVRLKLNDLAGALRDVQELRAHAPAGWESTTELDQLEAELKLKSSTSK